ncbi:MAG: anaerobic ribonucleoside-triphosphate reductase activating protein [Lentisphaeria bacterium]|nr:anaerobic ribonucleoside-triphosphate reductase activating protein [Lentisphaeria bacterium]
MAVQENPIAPSLEERSVINAIMRQPSMVDYPGHLGVLMFTSGCNFRCGFCHNPDLIGAVDAKTFTFATLKQRLDKYREEWVKAVTVTGGEPTIHAALPQTIHFLKEEGFLVKLDTNGANPEMLEKLLPELDYVAMDIKCALDHYPTFVKYSQLDRIRASIKLIMDKAKDYEFRTTVLEGIHTPEEIAAAAKDVQGAKRWLFQPFVPHENLPDIALRSAPRTKPSILEECAKAAAPYVQLAKAR